MLEGGGVEKLFGQRPFEQCFSCAGASLRARPERYFAVWHKNLGVTNSSSGLIFVKIRAQSGWLFSKNPGGNLGFCDGRLFVT